MGGVVLELLINTCTVIIAERSISNVTCVHMHINAPTHSRGAKSGLDVC